MERNKFEKTRKIFSTYAMVMQMIFSIIGLALLGLYIGIKVDPDGNLRIILTAAGLFLGLLVAVITLKEFIKSEERYERHHRD